MMVDTERSGNITPEGPELLRSRDHLHGLLVGRRLRSVGVHHHRGVAVGRYAKSPPEGLTDLLKEPSSTIDAVDVKGKFMWWTLSTGWRVWCTYGMSGQWTTHRPDEHTALVAWTDFLDGTGLLAVGFRDPRHFGTVRFMHDPTGALTQKKLATLGPDMLGDPPPTHQQFGARLLVKPQRTLAEALMDQRCVSGVGNYVKAEALWAARLSPHRTCADLRDHEVAALCDAVVGVMRASYASGGATIHTYVNPDGSTGGAQQRFAAYGRRHDPAGLEVKRETTLDGRTTWWVPEWQA